MTHSGAAIDATFPAETTPTAVTIAAAAVDTHKVHGIATMTGTALGISSQILCSLARLGTNAADTYNDYIYLTGADFHIVKNTVGSISEYGK